MACDFVIIGLDIIMLRSCNLFFWLLEFPYWYTLLDFCGVLLVYFEDAVRFLVACINMVLILPFFLHMCI